MAAERSKLSGWLLKRGGLRKSWKRRWFVLEGTELRYYKSHDETKEPAGTIDLRTYADGLVAYVPLDEHNKAYEFSLSAPDLRTYYMAAPNLTLQGEWAVAIAQTGVAGDETVARKVEVASKVHVVLEANGIDGGYDVFMGKEPMAEGSEPEVTKSTLYRYRAWLKKEDVAKPVKGMLVLTAEGFSVVEGDVETLYRIKSVIKYLFKPDKRMFRFVTKHKTEELTTVLYLASGALVSHVETTIARMIQVLLAENGVLATVLYDFESEDDDELNVSRGDKVAILEAFDDGWVMASLDDGTTGMIPVSHIYTDAKVLKKAKRNADDKLKRLTMAASS